MLVKSQKRDFHREQSWDRWLSATHNGMNTKKSDVLLLLGPLAQALSDDDFNEALNILQVRNLKYWVIWHIGDILITKPLNQNNNLPDTITKLNYDCISHIIYLFDLPSSVSACASGLSSSKTSFFLVFIPLCVALNHLSQLCSR
jgi:hypothetical protein